MMSKIKLLKFLTILVFFCFISPVFSHNEVACYVSKVDGGSLVNGRSDCSVAIVSTMYGTFEVTEPVLLELLQSPMMQRLKKIRQYGSFYFTIRPIDFTRYDHSIGVFALLRRIGASLNEQVAGLLHDISHPVFSHGGGYVFKSNPLEADAHQDDNHAAFLRESGVEEILLRHGLTIDAIHNKNPDFIALERSLPYLCADRIEYNIHGGLAEGLITQEQVAEIVDHLIFENGIWLFTDPYYAALFARISLWKTLNTWGSAENVLANIWTGKALNRALALGVISMHDIVFGTDDVIWHLLKVQTDNVIVDYMKKLANIDAYFELDCSDYDEIFQVKFRGVDPLVKTDRGVEFLSKLDPVFALEFEQVKNIANKGWPIKYKK